MIILRWLNYKDFDIKSCKMTNSVIVVLVVMNKLTNVIQDNVHAA